MEYNCYLIKYKIKKYHSLHSSKIQPQNRRRGNIYIPITNIHDRSLYWLFTSLLHIYMTGPFTDYLHPYYTYTWPSIYWLFASLFHIYMTGPFTGYMHPYYTYTWPVSLLVIYIPITHIHDQSLYWLFTFLLHIYMTGPFTGYLHLYYTYTWPVSLLLIYIPNTHIHDWSLYW